MSLAVDFPALDAHDFLFGHQEPAHVLEAAHASGQMHHAWLLSGPEGIGKSTLAHRFARWLLDEQTKTIAEATFDSPTGRKISSGAHPNFISIERGTDAKGNLKTEITIDVVRQLNGFFGTTAGQGDWRIVVVDSADELNRSASNALLKNLEEPPQKCVFILISHSLGRLLPTIKSRCRVLPMQALSADTTLEAIKNLSGLNNEEAQKIASLAPNAPGRALRIASEGGAELNVILQDALFGVEDWSKIHAVANNFSGRDGAEKFRLFIHLWQSALAESSKNLALRQTSASVIMPLVDFGQWLNECFARTEGLNLDRKQMILDAYNKWLSLPAALRMASI